MITKYVTERDQKSREIYILAVYPMFYISFQFKTNSGNISPLRKKYLLQSIKIYPDNLTFISSMLPRTNMLNIGQKESRR